MEDYPPVLLTTDPTQIGALYTTAEIAKLLRVHQRTVQEWIRAGMLPAVRYGRLLRIRHADLAAFGEVLNQRPPEVRADASPTAAPAGALQE